MFSLTASLMSWSIFCLPQAIIIMATNKTRVRVPIYVPCCTVQGEVRHFVLLTCMLLFVISQGGA